MNTLSAATAETGAARVPRPGGTPLPRRAGPTFLGVGTAVPTRSYTQEEVLDFFGITDARVRSVFANSAIDRRCLTLPPRDRLGRPHVETQGELLRKHAAQGIAMGADALRRCLTAAGLSQDDVGYLCCVSSTGLLTPGLSALLMKELGLAVDTGRLDVVGMGCNAGLNALNAVAGWSSANPGRVAVMVCVEVCSAAYVIDGTMRTSVVNSLFGDGAAAVALSTGPADATGPGPGPRPGPRSGPRSGPGPAPRPGPELLKFASHLIPEACPAMRYDWDDTAGKFSFFLDRDVPYVVGAHAETAVDRLLAGTGLRRSDLAHWVVHSGGKKVIDSVRVNLGLSRHDLRHTTGVLRDFGNVSSGSFLFSYDRLVREGVPRPGDHGVLMTMGPGSTIETALVRF
ncbi:type III polyketide synthase [Streptomyces sp. NBC_00669]|uniref:3,5-dihydroxyphenylacetyl-CoA synthase DpgA n=1 Tax=Streptomyces sp. NBC_00669 TaxID=2976011 RepID=UPI002E356064|nr:3,5-dihydroxyphenylacetyl-CoA synthase DpgA [Streptomyces sp. NBC_00669]